MLDLDRKLREGPLPVASLFHPDRSESVARESLRRRRRPLLALAGAGACALGLAVALMLRAAAPATPAPRDLTIRFADGSTAVPAGQGAQVQIDEQTATRVALRLSGAARFDVVPDRARTFEVRAGEVLVRVLGTAFSIDGRGPRTRVAVERGRVEVSWPGGRAILHPGDAGSFPREPASAEPVQQPAANAAHGALAAAPGPEPVTAQEGGPQPGGDVDAEERSDDVAVGWGPSGSADGAGRARALPGNHEAARAAGGWRGAARRGEYARAYAQLEASKDDPRDEQPSDLMLAADVARSSGHPRAAIAPLRALCERFPRDKRAPVAAFTLGRVLLDDLGRAEEAARAFARARELWPAGPLAEDALAREAEAWSRAGQAERARAAAQRYQQRFPAGRHRAAMPRFLEP